MGLLSALALPILAVILWFILTLTKELVKRLVDRAASWTLPEGQAWTFRIAWLLTRVASWIAPTVTKTRRPDDVNRDIMSNFGIFTDVHKQHSHWAAPAAARAELDAALASGHSSTNPVRLTLPLLRIAAGLRFANVCASLRYRYLPAAALLLFLLPGCLIAAGYRLLRHLSQLRQRPQKRE